MPLKGSVGDRIKELMLDNMKKGKTRGANGKKRSKKQMIKIAFESKRKEK